MMSLLRTTLAGRLARRFGRRIAGLSRATNARHSAAYGQAVAVTDPTMRRHHWPVGERDELWRRTP
mgnify:CR=1 FL=1